jgi:hypothetical protein
MTARRAISLGAFECPNDAQLVLLSAMLDPLHSPATDRDHLVDSVNDLARDSPALDRIEEGTATNRKAVGCFCVVQVADVGVSGLRLASPQDDLDGV